MIYLASPYSHPDPAIRQQRYEQVCQAAAAMIRNGWIIFSPIAHSHGMVAYDVPGDWEHWQEVDQSYIALCERLVVLKIDGWEESKGVAAEIAFAVDIGMAVSYVEAG